MYIGDHVKYLLFLSDLMKFEFLRDFWKIHIKFHEKPGSESWVVQCRRMDRQQTDRHTDMMKPIVAFCNSENAPKSIALCPQSEFVCFVWF